jgi:hypothetical protein
MWLLFAVLACPALAHDIVADVTVRAYLKPEAQTMHVILRVPLKAASGSARIVSAIELYEEGARVAQPKVVAVRLSPEADRSFAAYQDAREHVLAPESDTAIAREQAMLDVALDYPIRNATSDFSIRPNLHKLGKTVATLLWFLPSTGGVRAFEFIGAADLVHLDPTWMTAAITFVRLGFVHILEGTDHLLFLCCLVLPFRQWQKLLVVVTAFTVAHSITLLASAFGFAPSITWFAPLVEALIAASIVYMAIENIVGKGALQRRWMLTFAFGLVHGFGFSFALHETLQLAGTHLVTSLLAFNVGVELGQLLVLAVLLPALWLLFRRLGERWLTITLAGCMAAIAGLWLWERVQALLSA